MKAKVNLDYSFEVESVEWDLIEVKNGLFRIIYNDQSFVANVALEFWLSLVLMNS